MKTVISAFFALFLSSFAWAGPGSSGGGGGVACVDDVLKPGTHYADFFKPSYQPKGEAKFVWVLDYFQSKIPRNDGRIEASLFDKPGLTESAAIDTFTHELGRWDRLALHFTAILGEDIGEIQNWIDTPLETYADSGKVYLLPHGCHYVQLAFRQDETLYGDSRWIRKMRPAQRAALRIHEALYLAYYRSVQAAATNDKSIHLESAPVRVLFSMVSNIVPKISDEYFIRTRKTYVLLRDTFSELAGWHLTYEIQPVEALMVGTLLSGTIVNGKESDDFSADRAELCFDRVDSLVSEMHHTMQVTSLRDVLVESAKRLPNPECLLQSYVLSSRSRTAFATISGLLEEWVGDEIVNRARLSAEEVPYYRTNSMLFAHAAQWLRARRPYLEKMIDFDANTYEAVLLKLKQYE